jgi:hypothetical protein
MNAAVVATERPVIPVWRTAKAAYRLGFGAVFGDFAMFRYFLYAGILALLVSAGHFYIASLNMRFVAQPTVHPADNETPLLQLGAGLLVDVFLAFALAPFGIAMHRKVLLQESPRGFYFRAAMTRSGRRFFLAAVFVLAIYQLITLAMVPVLYFLYGINPLNRAALALAYRSNHAMMVTTMLVTYASLLVGAVFTARCSLLFPAAALDRPGPWFREALREARGATARLFWLFTLVCIPAVIAFFIGVVVAALVFLLPLLPTRVNPQQVQSEMMLSPPFLVLYASMLVIAMLLTAVIAAGAARAYEIRVNYDMSRVAEVFS